ncbi:MAG: AtpZ/AtpI family protein [Bacteroidota bacterium]|nr:AtpZ/AtpI family protein [Bacteroidota bacterium]
MKAKLKIKHSLKKQPNPLLVFAVISFEMGIIMFLFSRLGKWLDAYCKLEKLFTFSFTFLGFILAFYIVYKQVNKLHK